MNKVKEQIPLASKIRKYQLLSVIPDSMSVREAGDFFNVDRKIVENVRKITHSKGIIPKIEFSRGSSVQDSSKLLVKNYFCNDEHSKIMPGQRDCVSIRKGVYEQKRLLLSNLPELY